MRNHFVHIVSPLIVCRGVLGVMHVTATQELAQMATTQQVRETALKKGYSLLEGGKWTTDASTAAPASTTPTEGPEAVGGWPGMPVVMHEEGSSVGNKGWVLVPPTLVVLVFLAAAIGGLHGWLSGYRCRAHDDGRVWRFWWRKDDVVVKV